MILRTDTIDTISAAPSDRPVVLNRQRLDALVEYFGSTQTAEMIVRVVDGLALHMQALRRAEPAALNRLGHEIKGVASMYGLDAVAAAALALEHGTADAALPDTVVDLHRHVAEARCELTAFACNLTPAS